MKKIILLSIIIMIGMPFVINLSLTYIYTEIYGDIMLEGAANVLNIAIDILSSLTYILTIGLLINLLLKKSNIGIILYLISTVLIYGLGLLVTLITSSDLLQEHFVYIIPAVIADIVVLIAVIFICKLKINLKKCILYSMIIVTVVGLINNLLETVMLFNVYGFPSNSTEILFIAEPYISLIIYGVVGYFTILLLSNLLNKSKA